jgi:pilus assembly protein FimV
MANKNKIIGQAQKFITKGQWDKAVKELQKLVAEDPKDVRTLLKLGDVYSKKGDRDNATKVYKQVAESYSDQGFFLKAVAVYKQILKHDPKHLQVTLKLAELYEHLGLTSEAMVQYHRASQIQEEQGNQKETLDVLKRMVDLDADNVASRIKLAETFSRENRVPEAISEFEKAADVLKKQNRTDDYIKVAERLVYHDQSRLDVIKELARLYLDRGDAKRGLAKLQICFKAQPRDLEVLKMLSQAFTALGQHQKTIFVFKELARIYQDSGKLAEANEVVQQILQLDPNDPDARAMLAGESSSNKAASPSFFPPVIAPSTPPPPAAALNDWSVPSQPGYPFGSTPAPSLEARPSPRTPSLAPRPPPPPPADDTRPRANAVGATPPPAGATGREAAQINKILTETDVYIKYGLREKALSHLRRVFELDPDNVEAYRKMRDIFRAMGDTGRAAEALANLMHVHHRRGETKEMEAVRAELGKLVPGHPLIAAGIPGALPGPLSTREDSGAFSVDIDEDAAEPAEESISYAMEDEPLDVGPADDLLGDVPLEPVLETDTDRRRRPLISDLQAPSALPEDDLPEANSGLIMLSDVETGAEEDSRPSFAEEVEEDSSAEEVEEEEIPTPVRDEIDPFSGNERSEITARNALDEARREVTDRSDIQDIFARRPQIAPLPREVTLRSDAELTTTPAGEPPLLDGVDADLIGDLDAAEEAPAAHEEVDGDELDEAEFLIEAGLTEEAREAVQSLLERWPDLPRVKDMLSRVEALEREEEAEATEDEEATNPLTDAFTLPLDGLPLPADDGTTPEDRYDQGMLFKEIGRLDDAIREFRGAARHPVRELQSLEMIGHCLMEKGSAKDAVAYFSRALERGAEGISATNLKYEIGNAYDTVGDQENARDWFSQCHQDDPDHRDVTDRLDRLGGPRPPGGKTKGNGVSGSRKAPSSKKSKITYL